MELVDLESGLNCAAAAGYVLNCQEIAGLQASLSVLRSREKYDKIWFWGKIFGQKSDYYIAYGLRASDFEFPSKNFYCAGEDFEFQPLARLTEEVADRVIELGLDKPFTGVLTTPLEAPQSGDDADAPPADDNAPKPQVPLESDRLAQIVQEIDFDTAAVPKGAYALSDAHTVVPSTDFKGLGATQAKSLSNYVHFRPPTSVASLRALARTDVQFYANFLDLLESDLPKGCWAIREDLARSAVSLRSLNWPGYVAYNVPGTTKFGGIYFGYGQKNRDLPFLL